ncbi:hypothetical protein XIS1_920017 [Xenorhabdus innexi]|uniref:Integrase catalytic domain-containing protein n=1 Tax=Xenorhabdus innexi TaxID=290109 RepID=A0A1N6N226_9GAMM|nr:hypothetical protein XIS1_920017 [Xenorhabdus innexi]
MNEFYQVTLRKKLYSNPEQLQKNLDCWLIYYNHERPHQWKNERWENTDGHIT